MDTPRYYPYFRTTRKKHESGYLVFEVGYCMDEGYLPIAQCSDVIYMYDLLHAAEPNDWRLNIDSADYGYFKIFADKAIRWRRPVMSSAILEEGAPDYAELEKRWAEYKEKDNAKDQ